LCYLADKKEKSDKKKYWDRSMARCIFLIIFGLTLTVVSCTSKSTIVNSVPEREANEIVVVLNSKGIMAEKIPSPVSAVGGVTAEKMWDITVPPNQITDALAILNQSGLPRVKGTSLLDLFGTQGLVPSDMQDKIRYQEGLSEQLASTIRKMDGIIDANVQITFPSEEEPNKTLKASVFVKHRGILDNPNSLAISRIKRLVSSAIPGLTPENVTVVPDRALYADISLQPQRREEERQLASIWSVEVAKESAWLFRLIFYSFIILLFLLACCLAWLIWKFLPLIQRKGGFSFLFHPEQYKEGVLPEEETEHKEE
jgi:type III secretion protein J